MDYRSVESRNKLLNRVLGFQENHFQILYTKCITGIVGHGFENQVEVDHAVHRFSQRKHFVILVENKFQNAVPLQNGGCEPKPRKLSRGTP